MAVMIFIFPKQREQMLMSILKTRLRSLGNPAADSWYRAAPDPEREASCFARVCKGLFLRAYAGHRCIVFLQDLNWPRKRAGSADLQPIRGKL